jgi:16S rRNA (guanine527-N7)-methyltransferase
LTHPSRGRSSQDQGQSLAAARLDVAARDMIERWLEAVLATPGLTAIRDGSEARRVLLDDALRGVEVVQRFDGPVVDVGSGGGTPGIPLAVALPEREVTLLDAERRKTEFLRRWELELPNLRVVWGRAEEQPTDTFGVAVAKALAPPVVAAEWCLPLVRPGGAAILWVGPSAQAARVSAATERLGGALCESPEGFLVLRKLGPTPPGFPRRSGMAKKRPLA